MKANFSYKICAVMMAFVVFMGTTVNANQQTEDTPNVKSEMSVVVSHGSSLEEEDPDPDPGDGGGGDVGGGVMPTDPALPDENGFSVALPIYLPVNVNSAGQVEVANNAKIINYSGDSIKVSDIQLSSSSEWTIKEFSKNFSFLPSDVKEIAININGSETLSDGTLEFSEGDWEAIEDGEENALSIDYEVKLPSQSTELSSSNIMSAVFVIAWDE